LKRLYSYKFRQLKIASIWTFFIFGFFAIQEKTDWPLLRFAGIRSFSFFTDLGWVFKTSDSARIIGWDIYDPNPPKDYSAYLYGSNLIRVVDFLGITEAQTKIAGWILMLVFSILIGAVMSQIRDNRIFSSVFGFIVLISPPNQLLIERGNFDLVIIIVLAFISYLLVKENYYLVLSLLLLITLFKFYTLPLFIYLIYLSRSKLIKFTGGLIFIVTSFLVVNDLSKIKIDFPRPSWAAFGNPIFGIYFHRFEIELPNLIQDLIGLISLVIALIMIKVILRNKNIELPETTILQIPINFKDSIFKIFLLTFLICYFSSTSFDYRLFYLFVPALIYIQMLKLKKATTAILWALLILTAWLSYNSGDLQLLGDICILFWVGIFSRSILVELLNTKLAKIAIFKVITKGLI
jgi:hypothetical protein